MYVILSPKHISQRAINMFRLLKNSSDSMRGDTEGIEEEKVEKVDCCCCFCR